MNESMIYYWENRIKNQSNINTKINDYIVHIAIVDERKCQGINEWINCDSFDKLKSLFIYVILPSVQVTRALLKGNDEVLCFDSASYTETLEILNNMNADFKLIKEYKRWYEKADLCSNKDDFFKIKSLSNEITNKVDYKDGVLVEIETYQNIKLAGLELIKSYEEEDLIELLEESFNFTLNEIKSIFNNIDNNKFLLKRIMPILNNLNIL